MIRLVLWMKFSTKNQKETFIRLREKVACRFVTVLLIETDNRMGEWNDEHPTPNFDVRCITFHGERIPSHLATQMVNQ